MIRTITVRNFKSLKDFRLDLNHNTALVGLNAAGKSTVLQALDFLSASMRLGDAKVWLQRRDCWTEELLSGTGARSAISAKRARNAETADTTFTFSAVADSADGTSFLRWTGCFDTQGNRVRCVRETVERSPTAAFDPADTVTVFSQDGRTYRSVDGPEGPICFHFEGALLGNLCDEMLPADCVRLRNQLGAVRVMDVLSLPDLRADVKIDTQRPDRNVGERGERLTGLLFAMPEADFRGLVAELQTFFPEVVGLETRFSGNDTYRLVVRMRVGDREMEVSAAHCPDGLLRVLALLAEMRCGDGLLCLDEIENGLCMDVLDKLMRSLPKMPRQILFTTQSVIALNYVAREDVRILYRDRLGGTRSGLLADLKENRKYIDFYEEPGDALYFTSLVKASAELRNSSKTGDDGTT